MGLIAIWLLFLKFTLNKIIYNSINLEVNLNFIKKINLKNEKKTIDIFNNNNYLIIF